MSNSSTTMPSFRVIRNAIVAAPPRPAGFPLDQLRRPERLDALRAAPQLQPFLDQARREAARAQHEPLASLPFSVFRLFEASGDRAAYERLYFDRRRRLLGLALTAAVDQTDDPVPALADLIWALCDEYTWSLPAHLPVGVAAAQAHRVPPEQVVDLFAAETAHALAEAVSLLGQRLDPWLHYRVRVEVERRIFQPLFHDPRHFAWESAPMNWAAVCAGSAGMAALALEDDRERLAGMIDRAVRAMECFLEGFGDDGGCPEGLGYWVYGFGYYTYFAEALRAFTDGQIDLLQGQRISRVARFPEVVDLGDGAVVNFSDAAPRAAIHPGLATRLAERLDVQFAGLRPPEFHGDHAYRWGHITRDALWTDVALLGAPLAGGSFFLPDLAWVVDRHLLDGATAAFAAKGGHNGEPHNHNDLGHFILHLGGESLLADLGAGVYTRQYFGPQRYDALHTGSHGHSVPLIAGQPQCAGPQHAAAVLGYDRRPDGVAFALDLTHAYADVGLESFVRRFDWQVQAAARSATLQLADAFMFAGPPPPLEECFISLHQPAIGAGSATWQGAGGTISVRFDPTQFEPAVELIATQAHLGEPFTAYRLRLRSLEPARNQQASFVFECRLA